MRVQQVVCLAWKKKQHLVFTSAPLERNNSLLTGSIATHHEHYLIHASEHTEAATLLFTTISAILVIKSMQCNIHSSNCHHSIPLHFLKAVPVQHWTRLYMTRTSHVIWIKSKGKGHKVYFILWHQIENESLYTQNSRKLNLSSQDRRKIWPERNRYA